MSDLRTMWRGLQQAAARRRWLLSAGLAAAAVATALPAVAPAPVSGTSVLTAARNLAAGTALTEADVARVLLPDHLLPEGVLLDVGGVTGRLVAGAVRRGEPLTDVRLVGPGLLALLGDGQPGGNQPGGNPLVAVPVRLADPASAALLRPGDVVDVLGASTAADGPPAAAVLAAVAPVLAVPQQTADLEGALVVLAVPPATAARLAGAAVTSRLSVVVRR